MKEKKLQELRLSFYKIFSAFSRFETVSISKIVPMSVFTVIISVLLILSLQFILGIMALLSNVSIYYGSLHQTNSIALLSILLLAYFKSKIKGV